MIVKTDPMSAGLSQEVTFIPAKNKTAADIAMEVELKKQEKPQVVPAKALPPPPPPPEIPNGAMTPEEWVGKFSVFMGGSLMQLLRGVGSTAVADFMETGYEAYLIAYKRLQAKYGR